MAVLTEEARAEPRVQPPSGTAGSVQWWERLDLWVELLVLAACCAFVFVQLEPGLMFRNTTPSGGDTAAHVWWPAYLRDHLLPFRLAGWSPDFYAGFAAGQYYFPLPALLIVALDVVLPYNIAFKLITALGPMLLPIGAYVLARGLQARRPAPATFAVAAVAFLFFNGAPSDESTSFNQHIMGGTLASNLAGEFSFTIALAFALLFLGTFAYSLRTKQRPWLPALMLACTVTSHLVVGIFVAIGALVIWLAYRPLKNLWRAVTIGGVGTLLTAVWLVPLIATIGFTTDMRYDEVTEYRSYLFTGYLPFGLEGFATSKGIDFGAIFDPRHWFADYWPGAALLTVVALVAVAIRRGRNSTATFVLLGLTAVIGLMFRFWHDLQSTTVWNLRFLPFWYLCLFLLIGLGFAELIRGAGWLARFVADDPQVRRGTVRLVQACTVAVLTVGLSIGALADINHNKDFLPYWVRWNFRGYEDVEGSPSGSTPKKQYPEYRTLVNTLDDLPAGRALWEGNTQLNVYGSPLALMLLPYWTDGRIASMEGVYYEASATTPYHFMTVAALAAPGNASNAVRGVPYRSSTDDFALGVRWLQLMGVRYLVVHSPESKRAADGDDRLRLVATSPDLDSAAPLGWSIYRVRSSTLVEPIEFRPAVTDPLTAAEQAACKKRVARDWGHPVDEVKLHEWPDCIAVPWFNDPDALDRPLVDEGPSAWKHATPGKARDLRKQRLPEVEVTKIRTDDDSVSFRVSRTGVPVMVKTSFFPNWKVEGARGPYRATPNFMVVVPTEKNVELTYATTGAEWLGRLGTLLGLLGISVLAFGVWWRRRSTRETDNAGV